MESSLHKAQEERKHSGEEGWKRPQIVRSWADDDSAQWGWATMWLSEQVGGKEGSAGQAQKEVQAMSAPTWTRLACPGEEEVQAPEDMDEEDGRIWHSWATQSRAVCTENCHYQPPAFLCRQVGILRDQPGKV
jgi:hypothetical protein